MNAYNEITLVIENDQDPYYGDKYSTLRTIGCRYHNVTIKVIHSLAYNKLRKDKLRELVYKGSHADVVEAARKAFEDILNKRIYNDEIRMPLRTTVNYSGDWRKLPWVLEISEHSEGLQEIIRSVFNQDGIFNPKALIPQ